MTDVTVKITEYSAYQRARTRLLDLKRTPGANPKEVAEQARVVLEMHWRLFYAARPAVLPNGDAVKVTPHPLGPYVKAAGEG